jgi:hypothetical protein
MLRYEQIQELAIASEQDITILADFDDCIAGVIYKKNKYYVVYSRSKILDKLMNDNGWEYLDALDYYEFNIECAYYGPQSPLILIDELPDGPNL